jgi:hypothetical protein
MREQKVKGVAGLMATTVTNENTRAEGVDVDSAEARGRLAADMIAQRLPETLEPTVVENSGVFEVRSKVGRTLALVECHPMMLHADLGGEYAHAETVRLVAYDLGVSFACMDRL